MNVDLRQYGWDNFFADAKRSSSSSELDHGRVISVNKSRYEVITSEGVFSCKILGNIQFQKDPLKRPAVGDWVLLKREKDTFIIHALLERKSLIKRQKKHDRFPKPIAANIDRAVIVQAADNDFNIKRLERILVHIYEAGVFPLLVINKIDLVDNNRIDEIKKNIDELNIDVIFTSYKSGEGIDVLESALNSGETVIFIGSSGVGKSSIINHMLGEELQETQEVMERTGKGKHTTTARRLIKMENGVLVIDTPGTREFGMQKESNVAINESFDYIQELALSCRFSNCSHSSEPGCAVQEALKNRIIDSSSYERYLALQQESQQTAKQMRQSEKQSSRRQVEQPRSFRRGKTKRGNKKPSY